MSLKLLRLLVILCFPIMLLAQPDIINTFDEEDPEGYWEDEISYSADSTKGFIILSTETSEVHDGDGALKVEYSVQDIESWGGYSRILNILPGEEVYDWSAYDSISFWYYNATPQSLPSRVTFRFDVFDVSDAPDSTHAVGQMEFYYSFHYILDNETGWNEIKMPLKDGRYDDTLDEWNGEAFNRTGWAGITGNDQLDTDKIKGFTLEFSISGSGADEISAGTIYFDHMTLKGSKNKLKLNIGFEDGEVGGLPTDWTSWQSAWDGWGSQSHITVQTGDANSGDNWCELGVDVGNGYAVTYQTVPAEATHLWEFSAFIKDVSPADPAGSFASLKMEAWGSGAKITEWSDYQEGVTGEWTKFSTAHIMPPGTDTLKAVLVASKWLNDGIAANYGFDDILLMDLGVADTLAPTVPTGVNGIPDTKNNYNLVIWTENTSESGETYTVYASQEPITKLDTNIVELLGEVTDDQNSYFHRLYYPGQEKEVVYYYAVTCTDEAGNVSEPGYSPATVNVAAAAPCISMDPPADFAADGDLSEWYDSGILPFEFSKTLESHIAVGSEASFDDDDDLTVTGYMAMDEDNLYMAFDIIDDVYSFDPAGNFWEDDMMELYIGLYDQETVHKSYERGEEPDYKLILLSDTLFSDQVGGTADPIMTNASANYEFVDFGAYDWAVEVKIPFDSIKAKGLAIDDSRFHPKRGMKIPLDLVFHDSDEANVRDGSYSYSPYNYDNSHESPQNWYYAYIGDTTATAIGNKSTIGTIREFELAQNYPNPFNPVTTIEYTVPNAGAVSLTIYNVLGKKVATLVDGKQVANTYKIKFDGSQLASGLYFYKLQTAKQVKVRKMLLVK